MQETSRNTSRAASVRHVEVGQCDSWPACEPMYQTLYLYVEPGLFTQQFPFHYSPQLCPSTPFGGGILGVGELKPMCSLHPHPRSGRAGVVHPCLHIDAGEQWTGAKEFFRLATFFKGIPRHCFLNNYNIHI